MADGLHIVNTVDNSQVDDAFARMRKGIIDSAKTAEQQGKNIDASFVRVAASITGTSETIKKKLYVEQSAVNGITKKIIEQRAVIRDMQADVSRLGDAYRAAKKSGSGDAASLLAQYNAAKKGLDEERAALFRLNQERANASLRCRELRNQLELKKKSTEHVKEKVDETTESVDLLTKSLVALGGAAMLKGLVSQIVNIRGEFQQLEVAFKTMLGSEEKAATLMNQMVKTAAITPFDLKGVTDGAKQLLAYGVAAEEVNDTLLHLGDIAAGLSLPLSDLVYLYGTTITQGRMYTMDLRQFMGRGIPLAEELAKQFGVTKDKVGELVTAGKVGAEEFKAAIMAMSSEGGKFGGLMEEQSKTITGQISNLEDAIDVMFNEIGKNSESIISGAISLAASLVENYERVGRILLSLVAIYGTYKAAIMAVTAMKGWATAAEALHYNWLLLVEKAQKMLNATMLKNPYVLIATLIAGVVAALISMKTETERVKEAEEAYEQKKQDVIAAEEEHIRKIKELCDIASDEAVSTNTRREALNKLEQKYPSIFAKYDTEYEKLKNIKKIKEEIAELEGKKSLKKTENELKSVEDRIKELEGKTKLVTEYYQDSYKRHKSRTVRKSARSQEEEDELKALYKKREQLGDKKRKEDVSNFFADLTGASNEDIEKGIKTRKDLLAQIAMAEQQGKKVNGKITTEGHITNGVFTKDELQYQLNKLNDEKNKRNEKKTSSADWGKEAKKTYETALKAYNDFVNNKANNISKSEYEKKAKELKDALDLAKKEYDKTKKQTDKDGANAKKTREQKIREEERLAKLERDQALKNARAKEDLEIQTRQAEINAQEEGTAKRLKQIQLDYDKEELEIKRAYEDIKNTKINQARQLFEADPNNKGKKFTYNDSDYAYTDEENEYRDQRLAAAKKKFEKAQEEILASERAALNEYLREFGDYEQKRLAIAEEYAAKIAKAQSIGERLALEARRDKALKELDASKLQQNWKGVFDSLDSMSLDALKKVKDRLQEALEAKDVTPEAAKVFGEQLDKVSSLITQKKTEWTNLVGGAIGDVAKRMAEINEAEEENKRAQEALKQATEEEAAAKQRVLDIQKQIAELAKQQGISLDTTNISTNNAADIMSQYVNKGGDGKSMSDLFSKLGTEERGATQATEKLGQAAQGASQAMGKMQGAGGGAAGTIAMIDTIIHGVNDNIQSSIGLLKELGMEESTFGKGMSKFAESSEYATKAWESLKSGNVMGVAEGVLGSLRTLGEALGEWGVPGFGSSDRNLKEDLERLAKTNEALEYAIKGLTNEMKDSNMKDAAEIYKQQIDDLNQSEKATRKRMQRSGAAYSNGFLGIGGRHSSNYKIDGGMSLSDWLRVSKAVGTTVTSAGQFWNLTSEQMRKLAVDAPDLYAKLKDLADDGYANAGQYMDAYIEYAKQREELESAYREKLTNVSFDSLRDEFKKSLTDMNMSAEDFAENFNALLVDSIAEALMTEKYDPLIKDLYKDWSAKMEDLNSDGELSDADMNELSDMLTKGRESIYKQMEQDREFMKSFSGDAYKQEASVKGFQALDQDTGKAIEGRFTAVAEAAYEISAKMDEHAEILLRMDSNVGGLTPRLDAMQQAIATSNIHLADISKYTKNLIAMSETLEEIRDNTKHL